MTQGRGVKVTLTSPGHKASTTGEIRIQEWNKQERTRRALKFGGGCWALALVSVVLPIAHFVLVPGFFLAGPIVVYFLMEQESVVLGGLGTCPHCNEPLPIVRSAPRFPLTELCAKCYKNVQIEMTTKEASAQA